MGGGGDGMAMGYVSNEAGSVLLIISLHCIHEDVNIRLTELTGQSGMCLGEQDQWTTDP